MNRIHDFFFLPRKQRAGVTDSILLESGQKVLSGTVGGVTVSVVVKGNVNVRFRGEHYFNPKDFPEKLRKFIRKQENIFLYGGDEDFAVNENNWYETYISLGGKHLGDFVTDIDLNRMTVADARGFILDASYEYVKKLCGLKRYDAMTWPESQRYVSRRDCHAIDPESDAEGCAGNNPTCYDQAYMVPTRRGDYARLGWPDSQKWQGTSGVLADYQGKYYVPVEKILLQN